MFCDSIFGPVKQWGFLVKNLDESMACWVDQLGVGPWWGFRNVPVVWHFEGLETHDGFEGEYERNAAEAERWDGSDPYRLVSLP
jgi:hypothetical protein